MRAAGTSFSTRCVAMYQIDKAFHGIKINEQSTVCNLFSSLTRDTEKSAFLKLYNILNI